MRVWVLALASCVVIACQHGGGPSVGGNGGGGGGNDLAVGQSDGGSGDGGTSGGPCRILCVRGLTCCNNRCVNLQNDIHNCGSCGNVCTGPQPFCAGGCAAAPCEPPCGADQLCCDVKGPGPQQGPACMSPNQDGTCPPGQPTG
jgi:hypothetical protein